MTIDFFQVVAVLSGVVTIYGVVKIANTPLENIRKNTEEIDKLKKANDRRSEIDKAILNGLTSITNHMIDGNGIEKLKDSRDELQKTLNDIATK